MLPRPLRPLLVVAALLAGLSPALAQRTELDQLRKPTSVPQFWAAIKAEINQGKFDSAAEYLKGLLALNPTDKDLLALEEREGISAFLDLNNIPRWSNNEAVDKEAKENVQKLLTQMTAAVKKLRADPERIQKFIRNLSASPEERDYAFLELRKAGAAVMPQLIGAIQNSDLRERAALVSILPRLEPETVPALLAAFDIKSPALQVEFIDVLRARRDILDLLTRSHTDPRPTLWWLSLGNDLVASKARLLLANLTETPVARLPLATTELIRFAEDIYQHRDTFAKQPEVTIWKWDGRQLTSARATPSQAEEYYGLRYARWALEKDPASEAGQVTFLNIALEKAMERGGLEARLAKSAPAVHELLAVAPPPVLYTMLELALKENHAAVALGVTQVIGERSETHARGNLDALATALNSQDRRIAMAAADALIRLPGNIGAKSSVRIVEVYRAALAVPPGAAGADGAAAARPKALIADPNELRSKLMAEVVESAGYEPVVTHTGRETLRRLAIAADIDIIWVNHEIVMPLLPDFLAQARSDFRYGKLPLFVTVPVDLARARMPDIDAWLDRLDSTTRGWMIDESNLDEATKLARKGKNNTDRPAEAGEKRRLVIDRVRFPIRVDLHYDALRLTSEEMDTLRQWLTDLAKEHPEVRQTTWERQRILIGIAKPVPGLDERLRTINAGLDQVISRRVSESLFVLDLPSATLPEVLAERLSTLLRDFAYENVEGVRSRVLGVTREIPTTISLSSMNVAPPQRPGPVDGASAAAPAAAEPAFNAELERDKIQRAIPAAVENRLRNLLVSYRNVGLVAEPLNSSEVIGAVRRLQMISGPQTAPLSAAERKDHQRRAIEALRQMATGALEGYDVRPAISEILDAMRSDDLAPAAIEAAGRLPGKEPQQRLADVVINTARPASVRRLATDELVRNLQRFGPTSITDPQIGTLIRLLDEEKNADVKAGVSLVLGALPRDRVLKNVTDPAARSAWVNRLLGYQPPAAAPAPMNGAARPPEPKDDK